MAETKRKGLLFLLKYKKEDTFSKWIYTLNPDAADRIPALQYMVGLGLFGFYTVAALYLFKLGKCCILEQVKQNNHICYQLTKK